MKKITVIKQNIFEEETWRYEATEILREESYVKLEARYNRADANIGRVHLKNNDRFLEVFFADRWFNIFEIHDREDDHLKGWYCDICKPAKIEETMIKYVDLKIDLIVYPDGSDDVLDEDEFISLDIDDKIRTQARFSLEYLKENFFEILRSFSMGQG
jgi:hypothetical protein